MQAILDKLTAEIIDFSAKIPQSPVVPKVGPEAIRSHLRARYDFSAPVPLEDIMADVASMMRTWNLQTTHPRYFGLFNPTTGLASVVADALVGLYNPQLAAWSHAPAANEIEQFTLAYLMGLFGFDSTSSSANFTTGGAEANLSAVLAALTHHFPAYGDVGLIQGLSSQPLIYLSEEAHDSFVKIAHITGIGRKALRVIPTDDQLRMDVGSLSAQFDIDSGAGLSPFMVVGTAGTTGAGVIDPLAELAAFCQEHGLWFHVDAAWGGAAILSARLREHVRGIELADSITCDGHKWFSVSMAAGMFFCRHKGAVSRAFRVSADYMPDKTGDTIDPYVTTIQWSRRFIGLKLFMTLAEAGHDGLAEQIEHQADMGQLLRRTLAESGWKILNETPLPVVCFAHPRLTPRQLSAVLNHLYDGQALWISETRLKRHVPALRACITSFRTQPEDVAFLVDSLNRALKARGK